MDENLLYNLYVEQDLSQREVARRLGCSQANIRYWVLKGKIQKNQNHAYDSTSTLRKTCPQCRQEQDISSFYKRKDGVPGSWCKGCMGKQVVARQNRAKEACVTYKGGSCQACGFKAYLGALEFHHLNPEEKDFAISGQSFSRANLTPRVKEELDKCVLVCSNCHRMTHAGLVTFSPSGLLLNGPPGI